MLRKIIKYKNFAIYGAIGFLFIVQGCSFKKYVPFMGQKVKQVKPKGRNAVIAEEGRLMTNETNRVINAQAFREGGGLIVIPFIPGDGIEYNYDVNRSALMIVKSVAENLEGETPYTFLMTSDAELSDVIMDGVIKDFRVDSYWKKIFLKQRKAYLTIALTMSDRYSGEKISVMEFTKSAQYQKNIFDKLAYEIGREIASALKDYKGE